MSITIREASIDSHSQELADGITVSMRWLGQAGFEIFTPDLHIMIDPYLSNSLGKKYADKEFKHERMMPVPIEPSDVEGLDVLLCTHKHSDHIDPETTPILMEHNPECLLVVPRAEKSHVLSLGIDKERVIFTSAGETINFDNGLTVRVIPSAHEELKTDENGDHHFLGYVLDCEGLNIYHSGDCVPFVGQSTLLKNLGVDIAMLPINGRDEFRTSRGVPGNMKIDEALELCEESSIKHLICHHFGMFSFNTADMPEVSKSLESVSAKPLQVLIPTQDTVLQISE